MASILNQWRKARRMRNALRARVVSLERMPTAAGRSREMKTSLELLAKLGVRRRGHLGGAMREVLADSPNSEAAVVLAADQIQSSHRLTGLMSLASLFHRGELDSSPDAAKAASALALQSLPLEDDEIAQACEVIRTGGPLSPAAEILAGISLLAGSNRSQAKAMVDASGASPLLRACDKLGSGDTLGIAALLGERSRISSTFVEHFVGPALASADAYHPDRIAGERYGTVESLEAPPTAARSRRVSVWTFRAGGEDGKDAQQVHSIVLVGHGDASTQRLTRPALIDVIERTRTAGSLYVAGLADVKVADTIGEEDLGLEQVGDLLRGVRSAARSHGCAQVLDELFTEEELTFRTFIFMKTTPQAHGQLIREAISNARTRTGRIFELGSGPKVVGPTELGEQRPDEVGSSVPALIPILPADQTLTLPLSALGGLPALDRCAERYHRIIHSEREAEWRRRERRYTRWLNSWVASWNGLQSEMEERGREPVEKELVLLHRGIDLRTATSVVYDPPRAITKAERMRDLPLEILRVLQYLAWAKAEGETLRNRMGAPSAWQYTTLIDAAARGTRVRGAEGDPEIEAWRAHWSPLVQACCDGLMRSQGLDYEHLVDSGQLVFRVLQFSEDTVDLEPLVIWDPFFDSWPTDSPGRRLNQTGWALRDPLRSERSKGRRSRLSDIGNPEDLVSNLARYGTDALTELLDLTTPAFGEEVPDSERRRIEAEATRLRDPVDAVFARMRRGGSTVGDYMRHAKDLFAAGRETGLPDCWAFGLHFVGTIINDIMQKQERLTFGGEAAEAPWFGSDPYEVVDLLAQDPAPAAEVLEILQAGGLSLFDITDAVNRLNTTAPDYYRRCRAEGRPVESNMRATSFGPEALDSRDQYLYHLIRGEQSHHAARTLAGGLANPGVGWATGTVSEILSDTWPVFTGITSPLRELYNVISDQDMSLSHEAAARQYVVDTAEDLFEYAEMSYSAATRAVAGSSIAVEKLGELFVDRGEYARCVERLIGARGSGFAAADLPLALGVEHAGGTVEISGLDWRPNSFKDLEIDASRSSDGVVLRISANGLGAGRCTVGRLPDVDYDRLVPFFDRSQTEHLMGVASGSANEWVRSVRVPALGWRGRIAELRSGWVDFMLCCLVEERAVEAADTDALARSASNDVIDGYAWSGRQACHRIYDRS